MSLLSMDGLLVFTYKIAFRVEKMEPSPAGNYGTAKTRKASSFRERTPRARKRTKENHSRLAISCIHS